jgi:DNA-binding cell septation regulator SpoVG
MHVNVEWRDSKYPSFNVNIATKEGRDPFLTIRGCKIISAANGEFVSFPARKMDDGKYFNHVWSSKEFNDHVLSLAMASQPKEQPRVVSGLSASKVDDDSDVPF